MTVSALAARPSLPPDLALLAMTSADNPPPGTRMAGGRIAGQFPGSEAPGVDGLGVDGPGVDSKGADKTLGMFAEEEPSFLDILDIINPLQHIPVVNNIYRELTGDKIGVGARMVGGALFGGPIGLVAAVVNGVVEEATGDDVGGHLIALFKDKPAAGDTQLAAPVPPASSPSIPVALAEPPSPEPAPAAAVTPIAFGAEMRPMPLTPPPPAIAEPVAAPAAPPPVQAAVAQTMPLGGRGNRFLPTPARAANFATQAPPPVAVPISNSSQRSFVPITGARPNSQAPSAATVQQMVAAQSTGAGVNRMAPVQPGVAGAPQEWFASSMMQALDKYDRSAKLGAPAPAAAPVPGP